MSTKVECSPGQYTQKYCEDTESYSRKRYRKCTTPAFKRRRLFLKQQKADLRNKKELSEGTTYEPNIGFLTNLHEQIEMSNIDENSEPIILFFDLETGSFSASADILQIAAKCDEREFSVYIKPTQKIDERASQVNGLQFIDGNLQLHGKIVSSSTLSEAMLLFYQYLQTFGKKCILTAHNCNFDYPRLMASIKKVFMDKYFKSIIHGFADSLPIIKETTGKKGKGQNTLGTIAKFLNIEMSEAHNAICDVDVLEKILKKLEISDEKLIQSAVSWDEAEKKLFFYQTLKNKMITFDAIKEGASTEMRKRMIAAHMTIDMLYDTCKKHGLDGLKKMLTKKIQGKAVITKCEKVIQKLYDFLVKDQNLCTKNV